MVIVLKRIMKFLFAFERKYKYDFSVAMNYLNVNNGFLLLDFKTYRPNTITNDDVINHHQITHRDYEL